MILTIITFIIVLSVLVVVHEYGHFLLARICGIKVKEFAIGFGPKVFTWLKKNDTEFNVRAYPLGGFVSMAGESIEEMDVEGGFQSQPAWKRFLVVFAGPLFSFLFAVVIFMLIGCVFGFPSGYRSNKIQMVMPQTKAHSIGFKAGDEIISVNGIKSEKGDYVDYIHNNPGKDMTILVKRGKKEITFHGSPDIMVSFLNVTCKENPNHIGVLFDTVTRDCDLYKKGVSKNDILISINNVDINSTKELKEFLEKFKGDKLSLVVQSGKDLKTINVPYKPYYYECNNLKFYFPEKVFLLENDKDTKIKNGDVLVSINGQSIKDEKDFEKIESFDSLVVKREKLEKSIKLDENIIFKPVYFVSVGAFGFMPAPNLERTNLIKSVQIGFRYIGLMVGELFKVLTSREIKDNVGGPIAIVSATNSAVNTGLFSVVILTAGLSLSLAILNLLPIPVLDGGHIFIIFLEFIRRKRFTKEQLGTIQAIGLLILVFIFVAVMYSDISKLFTGTLQ